MNAPPRVSKRRSEPWVAKADVITQNMGINLTKRTFAAQGSLLPTFSFNECRINSYWDSHVVAAALDAGCTKLYSEDMQHGLIVKHILVIQNPFYKAA